jgi:hypothetical protein
MTFFNYSVPPLRRKQLNMDVQKLEGLWQVQFPLGKDRFYSKFYTGLDRACLLWSLLLIPMFGIAQFFPVSGKKLLVNLCPLWLGISGIGYLGTGFAVRSPALLAASVFHLSGILILPYTGCWSFLFTGGVMVFSLLVLMVFSLLVLAELQWDMRHPIN